jgi:hypothetical protein
MPAWRPGGGFEHNLQSLRVVDRWKQRYPAFDGLNLSFETREGILKHCSRARPALEAAEPGGVGPRVSSTARSPAWRRSWSTWPTRSPTTRTTSTTACAPACSTRPAAELAGVWPHPRRGAGEYPDLAAHRTAAAVRGAAPHVVGQVHELVATTSGPCEAAHRPMSTPCATCRRWPPAAGRRAEFTELKRFLLPSCTGTRRWCRPPPRRAAWWSTCSRPTWAARTRCRPTSPGRRPAARGGRLHRRHDRPLRAARVPPPDRAACCSRPAARPPGRASWPMAARLVVAGLSAARRRALRAAARAHGGAIVRRRQRPRALLQRCARRRHRARRGAACALLAANCAAGHARQRHRRSAA